MPPNSEQRIQRLIARGIMPTEAEQIVREVDAREGQILSESEAELLAISTDITVEADKVWVMYSVDVPNQYRRMWFAQTIK